MVFAYDTCPKCGGVRRMVQVNDAEHLLEWCPRCFLKGMPMKQSNVTVFRRKSGGQLIDALQFTGDNLDEIKAFTEGCTTGVRIGNSLKTATLMPLDCDNLDRFKHWKVGCWIVKYMRDVAYPVPDYNVRYNYDEIHQ